MIQTPDNCPRGLPNTVCQPLHRIDADEDNGFICCGHLAKAHRSLEQDRFRFCFKGATLDEMTDWDRRDLTDTIAVMSAALSADANREYNGETEESWNDA